MELVQSAMPKEVKILKNSCSGFYHHLVGQTVIVVEELPEDEGITFFRVVGDPIIDEELIYSGDVEILSYYEIEKRPA